MSKKMKKVLAFVLSVCMLCSLPVVMSGKDNAVYASSDFNVVDGVLYGYSGSAKDITIPDTVKTIGRNAFNMSQVTSVTMPDTVETIEGRAFYVAFYLTSITLSNNLKSIGDNAFYGCGSLTSITIPASVTSIDSTAFTGSMVTTIYGYTGSYAETFANVNSLTFVSLGNAPTPEPTSTPEPTPEPTPTPVSTYTMSATTNEDDSITVQVNGDICSTKEIEVGIVYDTEKVSVRTTTISGLSNPRPAVTLDTNFYNNWIGGYNPSSGTTYKDYGSPYGYLYTRMSITEEKPYSGAIYTVVFDVLDNENNENIEFILFDNPFTYKYVADNISSSGAPVRPLLKEKDILATASIEAIAPETETPVPTDEPTETPVPTDEPTETPIPSDEPTETPVPSDVPTSTPSEEPTPGPTDVTTGPAVKAGDANLDGNVALEDANIVLKAALGIGEALTGDALIAADIDGTAGVSLNDANMVLKIALGIPVDLPKTAVEAVAAILCLKKKLGL